MTQNLIKKLKQGLNEDQRVQVEKSIKALEKNFSKNDFIFCHSLRTALILKEMKVDFLIIKAGLLHHLPLEEKILEKLRGLKELCSSVKIEKLPPLKKWQKGFLNIQSNRTARMFFALTGDLGPIFILLAEKLDEMQNLSFFNEKDQRTKANLSLQILAPLAYGMGMGELKGRLEDLAFPVLYPKEYQWLLKETGADYKKRMLYLKKVKPELKKILAKARVRVLKIDARAKHYFSLYQKLLRYDMDLRQIYDLVAMRIIVPNLEMCYRTMGAIHEKWSPLPQRIKDYIASPKPNGYRSLHTTVRCLDGQITEFQIKTPIMHQEAEYGAAAHLRYKGEISSRQYRNQFLWLERLRQWQNEIHNPEKITEHMKSELFKDRVFIFTPQKDIIDLPKGASAVDFAFAVHTEIGLHCRGALVDGKITPLNKKLKTGQTVKILTDKNQTPSLDWLRFVKSRKARLKIKQFFQKVEGIVPKEPSPATFIKEKIKAIKKVLPLARKQEQEVTVLVGGQSNIKIKFSKCCSPQKGDEVVAFISVGGGASLHKKNCNNLKELEQRWPQRVIKAEWRMKNNISNGPV